MSDAEPQFLPLEPLEYMGPLVNDILLLRDQIARTFTGTMWKGMKKSEFYKSAVREGTTRKLSTGEQVVVLNPGYEILFLGCMRANVWLGEVDPRIGGPRLVGWIFDPIALWNDRHQELLSQHREIFDQAAGKDGLRFLRIGLASEIQIPNWGDGEQPNEPAIIYDILTRTRFVYATEEGSHRLVGRNLVVAADSHPKNARKYKLA